MDERLSIVIDLLSRAPLDGLHSFLDVGFGEGQITKWLRGMGKSVTATGLALESYGFDAGRFTAEYGVRIEECGAEEMPFADGEFDAVVMSHVLEHCPNVQLALQEVRRVISDEGYLFVFVPPNGDRVAAGHVSMGWNVGQLMYVLLLNGFDVKHGSFVEVPHNVVGFVRKSVTPLPALRNDSGDIGILNGHGLFPAPVVSADGRNDGFHSKIKCINWPTDALFERRSRVRRTIRSGLMFAARRLVHPALRARFCGGLRSALSILSDDTGVTQAEIKNPSVLR